MSKHTEFLKITIRNGTNDSDLFIKVVNQGIDSHLEAFCKSKFTDFEGRTTCNFHKSEIPLLLRRLDEIGTEEALNWHDDIQRSQDNE